MCLRFFVYHFTFIPHGLIRNHKWPAPNVSGFRAQLVRAFHRYRGVMGSNTVEVLTFWSFNSQLLKLFVAPFFSPSRIPVPKSAYKWACSQAKSSWTLMLRGSWAHWPPTSPWNKQFLSIYPLCHLGERVSVLFSRWIVGYTRQFGHFRVRRSAC